MTTGKHIDERQELLVESSSMWIQEEGELALQSTSSKNMEISRGKTKESKHRVREKDNSCMVMIKVWGMKMYD